MTDRFHVHIITPIISDGFRDDTALFDAVGDLCRLSLRFLDKGPASVESAVDEVLAAPGVVDAAIASERDGAQALVIDCMLDPGLEAAREAVSIPVIGAGEAGMEAAATFGDFSVVTVLDRQAPMFRALARRQGLGPQLASVRGIGVQVLALDQDRAASIAKTIAACQTALAEDGAEAIIYGCTGMLGFARPVAEALGMSRDRIVDPLPNAVLSALRVLEAPPTVIPAPERKPVRGFDAWPDLAALMEPRDHG